MCAESRNEAPGRNWGAIVDCRPSLHGGCLGIGVSKEDG